MLLHLLVAADANADPHPFAGVVVFGDSLSDSGQIAGITATNRNPDNTVGAVHSQRLASRLGLPLTPSTPLFREPVAPANNYAVVRYGSAEVLNSVTTISVVTAGPFTSRRNGYLVDYPNVDPGVLFLVWGGGNDIRDGDPALAAAENVLTAVDALSQAGARHVLAHNLPDVGAAPESALLGNEVARAQATQRFNAALHAGLSRSAVNVIQTDVFNLLNEVLASPSAFGFAEIDQSTVCYDGGAFTGVRCREDPVYGRSGTRPDPTRLVFFDGIHPTQETHTIVAQYAASLLDGPWLVSTLAEAALRAGRQQQGAVERHLQNRHTLSDPGRWALFAAGSGGRTDLDGSAPYLSFEDDAGGLTFGASYRFAEGGYLGLSLGDARSNSDFGGDRGGFDLEAYYASLFLAFGNGPVLFDAMATVGRLDYDDVVRKIQLGAARRAESGDTNGDQFAFRASLEADLLARDRFDVGPVLGLAYQDVDIDAYSENGQRSTSLSFGSQSRESLILRGGLFARYRTHAKLGRIQLQGTVVRERESHDDPDSVTAGLGSLPGSHYELPGIDPEDGAWVFDVGASVGVGARATVSVSYTHRDGDDSMDQRYLSVGLDWSL